MAEGMYVMDTEGRVLYVNPAARGLLGYGHHELLHAHAHSIFHVHGPEGNAAASACPILAAPRAGRVYTSDTEIFRRRDGSEMRVAVVSSPLETEGTVRGAVVLFRDISAEHQTRLRLQQADIAFRHMAEGIIVTDADVRIRAVNRAFSQITGYEEDELLGKNPSALASGRHDRAFYAAMWQALAGQGFGEGEVWNRRKGGDIYPEWLRITAVRTETGQTAGYIAVFSDVTDLRRNEDRLRRLAYHDQLTGLSNRPAFLDRSSPSQKANFSL